MDWTEQCVTVAAADTDRAAAIAAMAAPHGLYIEDYRDLEEGARQIAHSDLIDEELLARDRTRTRIHLYLEPGRAPAEAAAYLRERLPAEGIPFELLEDTVREEDWADNWKQYFKPLPVGRRLLIRPTWETADPLPGRETLSIDPGMAFGTGGHETTRLVLEALESQIRPGTRFLDVGCGSGILSIAALLLGASSAVGVDIDPLAVRTARENGELNGFSEPRLTVLEGDLVDKVSGRYAVVAANIVADAIIALSKNILPFLEPGGAYIVSGIIDTREGDVLSALAACGFTVETRLEQGGWLCMVCRHTGGL